MKQNLFRDWVNSVEQNDVWMLHYCKLFLVEILQMLEFAEEKVESCFDLISVPLAFTEEEYIQINQPQTLELDDRTAFQKFTFGLGIGLNM